MAPLVTAFASLAGRCGHGATCAAGFALTTVASFVTVNLGLWLLAG